MKKKSTRSPGAAAKDNTPEVDPGAKALELLEKGWDVASACTSARATPAEVRAVIDRNMKMARAIDLDKSSLAMTRVDAALRVHHEALDEARAAGEKARACQISMMIVSLEKSRADILAAHARARQIDREDYDNEKNSGKVTLFKFSQLRPPSD